MTRDLKAARTALVLVEAALDDPTPHRVLAAHDAVLALPVSLKDVERFDDDASLWVKLRGRCDVLRAVLDTDRRR